MKDDGFSVTFGQHVLRGERQALTLDGTNVSAMPLTLTNINVFVTNFTLLVLGNAAPLVTNKLAR
jgi:hypothetical protein